LYQNDTPDEVAQVPKAWTNCFDNLNPTILVIGASTLLPMAFSNMAKIQISALLRQYWNILPYIEPIFSCHDISIQEPKPFMITYLLY